MGTEEGNRAQWLMGMFEYVCACVCMSMSVWEEVLHGKCILEFGLRKKLFLGYFLSASCLFKICNQLVHHLCAGMFFQHF